jgi:O-antigen ligase
MGVLSPAYAGVLMAALGGFVATRAFGGAGLVRFFAAWPVRLAPLHLVAVLASARPDLARQHGPYLAVLALFLGGKWPRLGLPDALAGGLAIWATVATIGSGAAAGVRSADGYWMACAVFIACRHVVTDRVRFLSLTTAYVGGCLYLASRVIAEDPGKEQGFRPIVHGININYSAYSLVTAIIVLITVIAVTRPPLRGRVGLLCLAAILIYAIVRTDTRAALSAVVVGLLYLLVRRLSPGAGLRLVAVGAPLLLAVVALNLYGGASLEWLESPFQRRTGDLSGRLSVWVYARQAWENAPIAGVGPQVFPATNPMRIPTHNLVLTLATDLGTVGVLLYGATVASCLAVFRHGREHRHLAVLLVLAWLPIWMTGHWELSPGAWLILGAWSRLPGLYPPTGSSGVPPVVSTGRRGELDVEQQQTYFAASEGRVRPAPTSIDVAAK